MQENSKIMPDDIVTRLRETCGCVWNDLEDSTSQSRSCGGRAADEIERLRTEVARLGSFVYPVGTVIHDNPRKVAETLGSGEYISAPFNATVKDIHGQCRNEIERWQDIAHNLYLFIQDPCTHDHWCDVCSSIDAYEQAVRGE